MYDYYWCTVSASCLGGWVGVATLSASHPRCWVGVAALSASHLCGWVGVATLSASGLCGWVGVVHCLPPVCAAGWEWLHCLPPICAAGWVHSCNSARCSPAGRWVWQRDGPVWGVHPRAQPGPVHSAETDRHGDSGTYVYDR